MAKAFGENLLKKLAVE